MQCPNCIGLPGCRIAPIVWQVGPRKRMTWVGWPGRRDGDTWIRGWFWRRCKPDAHGPWNARRRTCTPQSSQGCCLPSWGKSAGGKIRWVRFFLKSFFLLGMFKGGLNEGRKWFVDLSDLWVLLTTFLNRKSTDWMLCTNSPVPWMRCKTPLPWPPGWMARSCSWCSRTCRSGPWRWSRWSCRRRTSPTWSWTPGSSSGYSASPPRS